MDLLDGNRAVTELLPANVFPDHQMPTLAAALQFVHCPPADCDVRALQKGQHPAQQRLAFEELLAHYLSIRKLKLQNKKFSTYI